MLDITLSPSEFNAKYGFSYEMYFIQACKAGDLETVSLIFLNNRYHYIGDNLTHTPLFCHR